MNIRAKMICQSVTTTDVGRDNDDKKKFGETVKLTAVTYGDSDENKTYSEYTPSASVEMFITNQSALGAFEPGEEYYVDFESAMKRRDFTKKAD